jgi:hypothetical protein
MSEFFENLELQMREEAEAKNPRSAVLASQMESEKRFGSFIAGDQVRVGFVEKELKEIAEKYASRYEVNPEMVYDETVSYLVKNADFTELEDEEGPEEAEGMDHGILPGIKEVLDLMDQEGHGELCTYWQERLEGLSPEEQVDLYNEVVDSFIEVVETPEDLEEDPNQYDEWDKTSNENPDLDRIIDELKEAYRNSDEALAQELHEKFWDAKGMGDEYRNMYKPTHNPQELKEMYEKEWNEHPDNPANQGKKEAALANFIGLTEATIIKEAGPIGDWLKGRRWDPEIHDQEQPFGEHPMVGIQRYDIPDGTWHDYLMKSNLRGMRGYGLKDQEGNIGVGQKALEGIRNKDGIQMPSEPTGSEDPTAPIRMPSGKGDAAPTQGVSNPNVTPGLVVDPSGADFEDLERANAKQEKANKDFAGLATWVQPGRRKNPVMPGAMAAAGEIRSPLENKLIDLYMKKGLNEKYATIIVESMGEMSQIVDNGPSVEPASDPNAVDIGKPMGGGGYGPAEEKEKYKNLDVKQKQKELGIEHQDFTDFGEPTREFVQPGGEAPYSENTKKRIDKAKQLKMDVKGVKQEDNPPKN